ncbi:MAG: MurR/RpiR family transcriptional regulator [Clostridia bacterium]|nr:MurR/RpiR family transcriptional regulator [Clostridia bacterium]
MPAIMKIRSAYAALPTAERKVADFILKNPTKAPLMVINEIANEVGVSVPSVTRLAKKLGYDGFLDFRVALASGNATVSDDRSAPINICDPDETVVEKMFVSTMNAIDDTLKALDKKEMSELANDIVGAKRIFIYGTSASASMAYDLAKQLVFLGYEAIAINDALTLEMYSKRFTKDDLLIGITRSGRTKVVTDALKFAKQKGVRCALVSNYINALSNGVADYFFCTSRLDDVKRTMNRETNLTMYVWANALTMLVARKTRL